MQALINSPFNIGTLTLPNRLIQGPLAGYSCAPFRALFYQFEAPAYCVSEMSSATDALSKHPPHSRYLYRSPNEKRLAYQLSGHNEQVMAQAALKLQHLGADLIDINCGCPKTKIRKKGAGSALLDNPLQLQQIIKAVREVLSIPLTIKIRIQGNEKDINLAKQIEEAGADALIVHGRRWIDDYDSPCDLTAIAKIKAAINIPVIANGDIHDACSLKQAIEHTGCDAYMIGRAGSGRPWIYQELLNDETIDINYPQKVNLFMNHLKALACLEDEYKAVLQSKSLVRYYFRGMLSQEELTCFYQFRCLSDVACFFQEKRCAT